MKIEFEKEKQYDLIHINLLKNGDCFVCPSEPDRLLLKIEECMRAGCYINCIYLDTGTLRHVSSVVIARHDAKIIVPKPKN